MSQKNNTLSNLQQRVLTAIVGIPIVIGAIYLSEWGYFALFFITTLFSLLEFYKLIKAEGHQPHVVAGIILGLFVFVLVFLVEKKLCNPTYYFLLAPLTAFIFLLKLYDKNDPKPFTSIAFTLLGIIYIAFPFSSITLSAFHQQTYSYQIVLGYLFILWASDTGAYFAGRTFGKTKLFERVSPKKSWEGSIGGTITALGIAYIISLYFHDLPLWKWLVVASFIIIAGTYGDLVESMFKRSMQIKDSGSVLPGHGGFLDRFDGLFISAPFVVAFLRIFS